MVRVGSPDIRASLLTFPLVPRAEAHPRPIALTNEILRRHMTLSVYAPRQSGRKAFRDL